MYLWVTLILLGSLVAHAKDIHIVNNDKVEISSFPSLQSWDVLAPFPTASREQGADPLQAYGGIFNLPRADNSSYPSDLFNGGFVGWSEVTSTTANGPVTISFNASQVNWELIESWAGQAGSMWQGWALSDFSLEQDTVVLVTCIGPGTFYVDRRLVNGDKYAAGYAMTPINLSAGDHTIYVLVLGYETAQFQCSIAPVNTSDSITVLNDIVAPNVVNGSLASPFFSIPVLNNFDPLINFKVSFVESTSGTFEVTQKYYPTIQSGQTLPINFELSPSSSSPIDCGVSNTFNFTVSLSSSSSPSLQYKQFFSLACLPFTDPYVFTFLDFDNSVQYAAARAPVNTCPETGCPVLLTLHGAGVDAASNAWTYAYYQQNDTWLLFPTNRRPYGWDWQGPGLQNAIQTLDSFSLSLPGVPLELVKAYKVNPNLVIYAGHSMGGHGCWTISTHFPDRALAVLPAAGWVSMGLYYPSFLRLGNSLTDPWVQMLMAASVAEYNDDFYTPHLVGIPLMIRMGSDDDNVPPYHLRRMARLVDELTGQGPHTVTVSEVPGQGHWFNGVVDDPILQKFFNKHYSLQLPALPENFTVVTLNPATSGGRGGLQILQLTIPYRAGRISVKQSSSGTWTLTTENVRRFGFNIIQQTQPTKIEVDGTYSFDYQPLPGAHYCNINSGWKVCADNGQWEQTERGPSNYGPIEQVLRAPLTIVYGTQDSQATDRLDYAIYMSNSLYYQSRYSIQILSDTEADSASNFTNVVLIGGPSTNSFAKSIQSGFPVSFSGNSFTLGSRTFSAPATGVAFLAPFNQNLCVVLEGTDSVGLSKAVQLFPLLSTITLPDYAVAGPQWGSNGGAGLQALGFWDNNWKYNPLCGYITSL